jgi:transcriptional regulator with XRE-family HTH domain
MTRQRQPTKWEVAMGKRLQQLRQDRGLTQTRLAELAGVPFRSLQNWEYGRRTLLFDSAIKLADALSITLDELAGRTPPTDQGEHEEPKKPRKGKGAK